MHNFRELQVWQIAMTIAEDVYKLVADLPGKKSMAWPLSYEEVLFPFPQI